MALSSADLDSMICSPAFGSSSNTLEQQLYANLSCSRALMQRQPLATVQGPACLLQLCAHALRAVTRSYFIEAVLYRAGTMDARSIEQRCATQKATGGSRHAGPGCGSMWSQPVGRMLLLKTARGYEV